MAIGALVLLSIATGSTAAYAAPNPPTVDPTSPNPGITTDNQYEFQGNMDAGVVQIDVESSTDGITYSPYCSVTTSPPATTWLCSAPTGILPLGVNYIRATATDAVPEVSAPGAPITVQVVNAPTIASPADGLITNDYQPTFSGAADGSFFEVWTSDFATQFCSGTVVNNAWNCTPATLADGDYTYLVQTSFGAAIVYSSTRTIHIDTATPAAPVLDPPATPANSSPAPSFSGLAEENASVEILVDGLLVPCPVGAIDYTGMWSCTAGSTLSAGPHTVSAIQTDVAGNLSPASAGQPLVITDNTPPVPPTVTSPVGTVSGGFNTVITSSTTSTVIGTGEPGATLDVVGNTCTVVSTTVDSGGNWTCQLSTPMTPDGDYDIYFGQTDAAGNSSPLASPALRFSVDTTPAPAPAPPPATVIEAPPPAILPLTIVVTPPPALPRPVETAKPVDPTTSGTPSGSGPGQAGSIAFRNTPGAPNLLSTSLPTLQDIIANPLTVAAAAVSSLALLFLVAFPAEFLNSTLDANYTRIFGKFPKLRLPWLDRLRDRLKHSPALGGLALTVLAALILSFTDPQFGFDLASLRLFLACAIGMAVLGLLANVITSVIARRRWNITSVIELEPFGLVIALAGVVLSRMLDFAPGLLIGLVLGLSLSASASAKDEARAVLVWAGVILGLACTGWLVYSLGALGNAPDTFAGALFNDSVAAIATEGISGLVIGLLPIGFLDGRSVYQHSRWWWLGSYLVALIAFFVIVVPSGALWGDIDGSFWIWLTVLLVFAALCVGVYLWFRAHPDDEEVVDVGDGQSAHEVAAQVRGRPSPLE